MPLDDAESGATSFRKIAVSHPLYLEVVRQVEDKIVSGKIEPGDMLPPERVLVDQFGVSRTVVREAVKALELRGLVDVQRGRGIMVAKPSADSITNSMVRFVKIQKSPIWALLEVRRVLEIEIAALAAARRTEADLEALDDLIARMSDRVDEPQRYVELDFEFHQTLARAAHNPLFPVVLDPLTVLMREARRIGAHAPGAPRRSITFHRRLLEAVRNQNIEDAMDAMREHFEEVAAFIEEGEKLRRGADGVHKG